MADTKKKNAKSVRLSDEVLAYIEKAPGNGFNEKFHNIILEAKNSEQERKARLAYYDGLIKNRQAQLSRISARVENLTGSLNQFRKEVNNFYDAEFRLPFDEPNDS